MHYSLVHKETLDDIGNIDLEERYPSRVLYEGKSYVVKNKKGYILYVVPDRNLAKDIEDLSERTRDVVRMYENLLVPKVGIVLYDMIERLDQLQEELSSD